MFLNGPTVYTQDTPYGPYSGIWMPHVIGAFFPLGWLPCLVAAKFWFVLELVCLILMIWLIAGRKLPSPKLFGLCLLLIFLFPPLYLHLTNGQITILTTVLLMLVIFLPRYDYPPISLPLWMSFFLALALAKPLIGVLVYPGLLVKAYQQHGFRGAVNLILSIVGWVVLLIVPLSLIDPGWQKGFIDVITFNVGYPWDLPVPYAQLKFALGPLGIFLWALIFVICLGIVLWLWLNQNPKVALLWSFALTPIATPYCSSWDFILMLPLLLWLLIHTKSLFARWVLIAGYLLVIFFQISLRWHTNDIPDGSNWWIPISLLVVFILTLGLDYMHSKQLPAFA